MAEINAVTESVTHEEHAEPTAWGLDPPAWIAVAMLVVFAIMLWKKVPAAIGKALDKRIAQIRDQLAEAEALRKEAEALKAEYEAKAKAADGEAAAIIERANAESKLMIDKAKTDAEALVERRSRMAEEKIAAEERAAIMEIRAATANTARRAAEKLISDRLDQSADQFIVDQAISSIGR